MFGSAALALMLSTGAPASAQTRELCADRPGLGTPACTVEPGRSVFELGLVDWTLDRQPSVRTDTIVAGDILLRVGLTPQLEAQVGWTAYGHVRSRDRPAGPVTTGSGTGDVRLSVRRSLSGPNGPVAIQPFVTLPTGGAAIGAGDWGAGVLLPFGFNLGKAVELDFTPEVDAAVDQDGSGRHLAFGGVVGLSTALTGRLGLTAELAARRDQDPFGTGTTALASLSLAYRPGADIQLDVGSVAGLNRASPDVELYVGVARRF